MTICFMCDGKGRIATLENEICRFCNGTGKYTQGEDNEAIAILDGASDKNVANAGDLARIDDFRRTTKKRV